MKSILNKSLFFALILTIVTGMGGKGESHESIAYMIFTPVISLSGYESGIQIINQEDTYANIVITGYNKDGSQREEWYDQITSQGTNIYDSSQELFPVPAGFSGSFVITSDKKIAATATLWNPTQNTYASYGSRHSGSNTISLPLLMNNVDGFTTWYGVQNAGDGPATFTVEYSDGAIVSSTIPVGASKFFYQKREDHADNSTFAATITSDQPIVAAVIQESDETLAAYTGIAHDVATTHPLFPMVQQNNEGNQTAIHIQNIGDEATEVTLTYQPEAAPAERSGPLQNGTACTETLSIDPGLSATFASSAFQGEASPGSSDCIKEYFVGSAVVTANSADQPLAGIANTFLAGDYSAAYGGFDAEKATNAVLVPSNMDRIEGTNTKFIMQHVGGPASSVVCTFNNSDHFIAGELGVGGLFTINLDFQVDDSLALCVAENQETRIVAVVNQTGAVGFLAYEGLTLETQTAPITPTPAPTATSSAMAQIAGRVVDEFGEPLDEEITVVFYQENNDKWIIAKETALDASGNYQIAGLDENIYRIGFFTTGFSEYVDMFHDNAQSLETAADVMVRSGQTVTINAVLQKVPIPAETLTPQPTNLEVVDEITSEYSIYLPMIAQ